ncbi:DUF943 family protein [Erwinia papayae]|uniref:DUF943 family protein n=1 Tax=Erwinia papayae TaxID=206499 RepID=A0ABV3N3Q2_9GAMM
MKNRKILAALFLTGGIAISYLIWLSLRPVVIIAVHKDGAFSDILVENFPITGREKINWWLQNEVRLKEKYEISFPKKNEFSSITFWNFGDGYKEEGKYDRLCFEEMKTKKNCIEKEPVFSVSNSRNRGIIFTVYDGTYHLKENGEVTKVR